MSVTEMSLGRSTQVDLALRACYTQPADRAVIGLKVYQPDRQVVQCVTRPTKSTKNLKISL